MSWTYEEFTNQESETYCPVVKFHLSNDSELSRISLAVAMNQPLGSKIRAMTWTSYMIALIFKDTETAENFQERIKSACKTIQTEMFPTVTLSGEKSFFDDCLEEMDVFEYVGQHNKDQPNALFIRTNSSHIGRAGEFINKLLLVLSKPTVPEDFLQRFDQNVQTNRY